MKIKKQIKVLEYECLNLNPLNLEDWYEILGIEEVINQLKTERKKKKEIKELRKIQMEG